MTSLKWFWDSTEAGTEAWIVDRSGFVIVDGLNEETARTLVRKHNAAIRMAWDNEIEKDD